MEGTMFFLGLEAQILDQNDLQLLLLLDDGQTICTFSVHCSTIY